MNSESTPNIKQLISVAVPTPLYKCFDYYLSRPQLSKLTPSEHLLGHRVKIPFGPRQLTGIIIACPENSETPDNKLKEAQLLPDEKPACSEHLRTLVSWASVYYCHPLGECFQSALPSQVRKPVSLPATELVKWQRTSKIFEGPSNAHQQRRILEFIESSPDGVWHDNLRLIKASAAQLRNLRDKGYLTETQSHALSNTSTRSTQSIQLNSDQQKAAEQLSENNTFSVSLLEGITGSGKTEVYIHLVRQTLKQGAQALILIPEINLSPQTFARFQSQLDSPIAVIHSGLSEKQKYTNWQMARQGIAKVIIGTRSAIFTPFEQLGLIVVDEEHDSSYKQMDGFKYSSRDLAIKRGQLADCPVILGSATPSLETLYQAQQGQYKWVKLERRAGAGQLPRMQLIDVKSRPLDNGCSPPLFSAIDRELAQGNQVILFQNRRGYSPTLMCETCGELVQCPHCDARLTLHSQPPHLHCHHCDYKQSIPTHCPSCQQHTLVPLGYGTERIEQGLAMRYPSVDIIRIDRDRIKNNEQLHEALDLIQQGNPAIIIGTQMLAKGHDFHHVTLVAVLDADGLFFSADFRAIERGAQQLIQVSGRTGRGHKPGTVMIQTRVPEHPLFSHLSQHHYLTCALEQLEERVQCQLPPHSKMISIRGDAKDQSENFQTLGNIAQSIRLFLNGQGENMTADIEVVGPIEATMARRKGLYRSHISIIASNYRSRITLQRYLPSILAQHKRSNVHISIDVDPLEYL